MGVYDRDYLRGVALSTALLTLPGLSASMAWLFFLSPLPLIYFPIAHGLDKGFRIIFHAILIATGIALLIGNLSVLLLSLSMMPAGFMMAKSLYQKRPAYDAFSKGTVALTLSWILAGALIGIAYHVNLYQQILQQIDTGLTMAQETYSNTQDIPLDTQVELQAAMARIRELTPRIFPGVLATLALSTIWLNFMTANWLLKKSGQATWGDLSQWRLPEPLVWLFISAGIMLFVPGSMNTLGLNLMIVMVTLYFMQGYEVFNHLCLKWSVPKSMRFLIIFFLVIQAYGFILLALLGLADIWADFRKPQTTET